MPETMAYASRHAESVIRAVAERIESGLTDAQIAALPGMPSERGIHRIVTENPELASLRACAREVRADGYAEQALAIIDEPLSGNEKLASAEVTRAKNRADMRRWLAGCYWRDLYGDRSQVDVRATVATLVAFVDATPRTAAAQDDAPQVSHVSPPDVEG